MPCDICGDAARVTIGELRFCGICTLVQVLGPHEAIRFIVETRRGA